MEDDKKKKSFSENAKDFLGAWKDNFAEKNKDILDRAKKRREEDQQLQEQIKMLWADIKVEFGGTAKEIFVTLKKELDELVEAAKEGNATVAQKLQVEKRLQQMTTFLETTQDRGKVEFEKVSDTIKEKMLGMDLTPNLDNMASDLKNQADESLAEDNLKKLSDMQKNAEDINKLFSDDK
jgi:hypothetical protein